VISFQHLGREIGIGANSYVLEGGADRIVLDAGYHPKKQGREASPNFSLLGERGATAAIITHAHQDHVGSLPVLTRLLQQIPVFLSEETGRISDIMLHNSVNVMKKEQEERGAKNPVLFTHRGVELSRRAWQHCKLRVPLDFRGDRLPPLAETGENGFEFYHSGHILGSTGVMIKLAGKTIFYTGDAHFKEQTLLSGAAFPQEQVDTLIMETTRGDAPSEVGYTREKEKGRLGAIVREAFEDSAAVTIPVFALGKTQELLAMLWELRRENAIPVCPVYIGGLSTKVTEVYDAFSDTPERLHPGLRLLEEVSPVVISGKEIADLRPRPRCIYALSSGMLAEKTLSNLFVRRILEDPKQRLVFVGYSDPESPAGIIRRTPQGGLVTPDPALPALERNCRIDELNFSAHADRECLLEYAVRLRPANILLVHGDRPAMEWFRRRLSELLPQTRIIVPEPGVVVEIE